MRQAAARKMETGTSLLEAAKKVLRQNGYSGLSTRDVAAAAGVPLSQIHYHFGSKQGLVLALFDYLNDAAARSPERAVRRSGAQALASNGIAPATISTTTSPRATCASCRS